MKLPLQTISQKSGLSNSLTTVFCVQNLHLYTEYVLKITYQSPVTFFLADLEKRLLWNPIFREKNTRDRANRVFFRAK